MAVCGAMVLALLLAQATDYGAEGLKALDAKQPASAETLFRKAIEADAADLGAHFNLALALSLQGKDEDAVAEYRKTLELRPGLYEANLNLGILLLRERKAADALAPLKQAVEAKAGTARPNLYYGQALLETGDAAGAGRAYGAAAEADPKSAAAQSGLGRALLAQGKLPEALEHFGAAADKDGALQVAAAFEKAGLIGEAISVYKEFPGDGAVLERLGRLQIDNKEAGAAIGNLEEAVRKAPTTANRLALADAYKLDQQPAKMMEQLQLAAAAAPDDYELHMSFGRALRDQRALVPAARQFRAAARLRPDSAAAWNELASALIIGEDYAEGLAALDRVRALGKDIPGDYFLRATTLDKLSRANPKAKPQAVAEYRRFLAADNGAHPDQEFQARARIRIIESELNRK